MMWTLTNVKCSWWQMWMLAVASMQDWWMMWTLTNVKCSWWQMWMLAVASMQDWWMMWMLTNVKCSWWQMWMLAVASMQDWWMMWRMLMDGTQIYRCVKTPSSGTYLYGLLRPGPLQNNTTGHEAWINRHLPDNRMKPGTLVKHQQTRGLISARKTSHEHSNQDPKSPTVIFGLT